MKCKSIFLYIYFLINLTSCTVAHSSSTLKNVPNKEFVKVFKTLEVVRCHKKDLVSSKKTCEKKVLGSSGSGVYINLVRDKVIVLTAGHVCDNMIKVPDEDENYTFHINSNIVIQNYEGNFYNSFVILSQHSQKVNEKADLCSLVVDQPKKSKGMSLERRPPRVGEDIYYMGAPSGIYHPPTALIIKGVFSGKIDDTASLTSAVAAPGASGSAILSYNNKIYGVLFAVHPSFPAASIITNYKKTKDFLHRTRQVINQQ